MQKIEPPPPDVLKDLAKTSLRMLTAVANGEYLQFNHSGFEEHDMIIFDAESGAKRSSYGTITGSAWLQWLSEWMFVIAPAQEFEGAPSDDDLDYPLILVFERNIHLPKYCKGDEITERKGVAESSIISIIDERKVVLDAEGKPAYHYRFRHDLKEGQLDMTEEEVKAIEKGH